MRITDDQFLATFLRGFETNRANLDRVVRQLADGKAVRQASDDPVSARASLELRSRLVRLAGFDRSARAARLDLATSETAVGSAFDILTEARETALSLGSPLDEPDVAAAEIDALRERLLDLANTVQNGRYLFAGTQTLAAPFDPLGGYSGDDREVEVPLDAQETVGATLSGRRVFLDGGDPFATLTDLATALRNNDATAVDSLVSELTSEMDHLRAIRAEIGGRLGRIDGVTGAHSDERVRLEERVGQLEDADLARALLEADAANASFEALAGTAARAFGRSLFDFLG